MNTGVPTGTRLRKVVGVVFRDDRFGGHYWERLECGHDGDIASDGRTASQRWCRSCPRKPRKSSR